MKKSIILLSLMTTVSSFAGETDVTTIAEPAILPPAERQKNCITLQAGVMHCSTSTIENVPERLYGITLSAERLIAESANNKILHTVGCSLGFYTADDSADLHWKEISMIHDEDMNIYQYDGSKLDMTGETSVSAIPIMAAYNVMYEATESLYFYAGVRGGVVIRNTDISIKGKAEIYMSDKPTETTDITYDDSSTKVLPTLGIGIGMRAYMTERWAFDLSYDFTWTFGDDCDDIVGSDGSVLEGTTESSRYYGTIRAGVSYSF